jgi:hypothetical protein
MSLTKLFKIAFLILVVFLYLESLIAKQQRLPSEDSEKHLTRMWQKLLKDYPVPKNAIELELKFSFPSKDLMNKDIYLYGASFISNDFMGNIYVSDSKAHRIIKFDSSGNFSLQFGRHGQGPGEFDYGPFGIMATKNFIVVNETGRFQFFDENGNYIKSFKIYKTYREIAVDDDRLIFAAPILRGDKPHLIDVLSSDGELLYSFGEPREFKYDGAQLNDFKLALNKRGELFLAFKYFPIVRKYSKEGKLLAEFKVEHDFMKTKEKINFEKIESRSRGGERVGYAIIIYAVRATDEKIYILHTYPRIEILEVDNNGKLKTDYWKVQEVRDYYAADFLVGNKGSEKIFYVLPFSPENRVDVFGQKHK